MALAAIVIVVLTLTPGGVPPVGGDGVTAWHRVSCVTCPPTWLADIISNVVLFIPLGAALVYAGVSPLRTVLLGAAASMGIELLQFAGLPSGRAPALADLCSNAAGTLLGARCARHASTLLWPDVRRARLLRTVWALACAGVLFVSALALSPATPERLVDVVRGSTLPFTPGYGWSSTEATEAVVNGTEVRHRGNGPVIVASLRPAKATASVTVRGRDGRDGAVPIVFVHDPAMTTLDPRETFAYLLLAQRGRDASLSSDLRAGRWGLSSPALLNRGAFVAGRSSVSLRAGITADRWTLDWRDPNVAGETRTAVLRLSPSIAWALVQGVVPVSSSAALLMTVLWLFVLFAPLGYWGQRRAQHRTLTDAVRTTVLVTLLLLIAFGSARVTGTAPLSVMASAGCVLASLAGLALRRVASAWSPLIEV